MADTDWRYVQRNKTNGQYRTTDEGGGGGSSTFAGLSDVDLSNLQNGQVPKYNSATQKWENANESGGGGTVTDVEVDGSSVVNLQGVAEIPAIPEDLADLSDVQFSNLADHQLLRYNATSQKWVNGADSYPPLIYSDEEREVGVWRDGKPLYQKTIVTNQIPNNQIKNIPHNISNIDKIVNIEAVAHAKLSVDAANTFTPIPRIQDNNTTNANMGIDVTVTNICLKGRSSSTNFSSIYEYAMVTLWYTKTTDTPGSGTWTTDGTYAKHYSTSEKVIGTWIDGKPIYEKVVTKDSLVANNWTSLDEYSDIDTLVYSGGQYQRSWGSGSYIANFNYYESSDIYGSLRYFNGKIQYRVNGNSGNTFSKGKFIVQYTKTTD